MQFTKSILALGLVASSVSASVIVPRQSSSSNSTAPNVPTCTNVDPNCNVYGDIMVCVPSCYTITGADNYTPPGASGSTNSQNTSGNTGVIINGQNCSTDPSGGITCTGGNRKRQDSLTNCDFTTLQCTDGKQLTGCRIPNSTSSGSKTSESSGGTCGVAQGDGRDTGAAAPGSGSSSSSSSASATQASSSAAATSSAAAATTPASSSAAAASASASSKSNGAAGIKPQAAGALLAVGAFAAMMF